MSGIAILTDTHYSVMLDTSETGPRPPLPEGGAAAAAADQLRATWGPVNAFAGTYELEGDLMTLRHDEAADKSPGQGVLNTFKVTVEGNTVTTVTVGGHTGPVAYPATYKWTCPAPPETSPDSALGSWAAGGGRMPTKRYSTEQIISQLRPHSTLGYRPPAPVAISPASRNGLLMSPALA